MLEMEPILGRPRRLSTCKSTPSMPRLSSRRPTRSIYLEHLQRPWTWTNLTKTQIEGQPTTSRPSLPFWPQFLPFPVHRASSRLQPPILCSTLLPLAARCPVTQPSLQELRCRQSMHPAPRPLPPSSSARKPRSKQSSKPPPLYARTRPVKPSGPSSQLSEQRPCVSSPQPTPALPLRQRSDRPKPPRPPAPDRPPPDASSRTAALAAWDDRRCIVVAPPDDKMRRAGTNIVGMGAALTDSLRPLLKAPHGRVVDQL